MTNPVRKKLIEVALPLEAINEASAAEKQPGIGAHPRGLHLWWARRPLAAARAVIFAQMVDDPSSWPDLFPTEQKQEKERQRLFRIIEKLVLWENTTNEAVLEEARDEIWRSWRRTCAENTGHPQADELFNREKLPGFHDPFAGGGALPLEAQRLGLESYASDLNPVAVLINKAMIEIPPKFAGQPPVNPDAQNKKNLNTWEGARGLAEDVRYYGQWMRDEAEKRIGHLYPKVKVMAEMVAERPDLKPYLNRELTVIAWIWARTVKSPNPAFRDVDVPLASTFMLSTKAGKDAYIEPVIENGGYRFVVKSGKPKDAERAKRGTKLARGANFECVMSGSPLTGDYIKGEGVAGRMESKLMAIVAEGDRGRVYLSPNATHESTAKTPTPNGIPELQLPDDPRNFWTVQYGLRTYGDLFTSRQLTALTTFSDLVAEAREKVKSDAEAGHSPEPKAYANAVGTYLAFAINRLADYNSSIATWKPSGEQVMQTYKRQAIPMTWDYPESNVLGKSAICWANAVKYTADNLLASGTASCSPGVAQTADASDQQVTAGKLVSTDPPYYDNIGYADLSDFFYVWLRKSLRDVYPDLFATIAVPKAEELVATPYRHGGKDAAEKFFLDGMTEAMGRLCEQAHPSFPVTIYYAFKQSETTDAGGQASTGWETFLEAVIRSGFALTGTWPMRTELGNRMIGSGTNALASSIVLVCRRREASAPAATRREFLTALQKELPKAISDLQRGNVAPVDMQQAAIGPGMAIFTRYAKVLDADGKPLSVRDALMMINQALDEVLAEQEGDFDSDTRWALSWFEQFGFAEGDYGDAETLSKAKNTSVGGIVEAGIATSGKGKVRLLRPEELPEDWTPEGDKRLTVWDMVHHLIRVLEKGETEAAALLARLGIKAETARELAYRLYSICDRMKRSADAQRYNALVSSWPELVNLAQHMPAQPVETQGGLFEGMN
ncbi:MAG: DUF1156 domain-containing protein [Fimbriimonadaceae bacterium]|nr:DUF1156 domain-containing protein [Fimbriimonadaceae bacterium]